MGETGGFDSPGLSYSERAALRSSRSNTGFWSPAPLVASRTFMTCRIWWSSVGSPPGDLAPGVSRLGIPRTAITRSQARISQPFQRKGSHPFSIRHCDSQRTGRCPGRGAERGSICHGRRGHRKPTGAAERHRSTRGGALGKGRSWGAGHGAGDHATRPASACAPRKG